MGRMKQRPTTKVMVSYRIRVDLVEWLSMMADVLASSKVSILEAALDELVKLPTDEVEHRLIQSRFWVDNRKARGTIDIVPRAQPRSTRSN
jgi:hypothetical protein